MVAEPKVITLEDVKANEKVQTFIRLSDEQMEAIGYTEHGFRHVSLVAHNARRILQDLGFNDRQPELAAIAGYLHDVGNMISRIMHSKTGAIIAMQVLMEIGMLPEEIGVVAAAIGNHDEQEGGAIISPVTAALLSPIKPMSIVRGFATPTWQPLTSTTELTTQPSTLTFSLTQTSTPSLWT